MEIGEKIRRARLAHKPKMSLEALGKLVGVSRSAVHQWESGAVQNILLDHRIRLSEVLAIPIAELLPPEATAGEVTIRDPQEIALHRAFGAMSAPRREAYLRLILVMEEEPEPEAFEN